MDRSSVGEVPSPSRTSSAAIPSSPPRSKSSKQKRPPPITPKRFTRFFTPRTRNTSRASTTASRRILRDVTTATINRSSFQRLRRGQLPIGDRENIEPPSLLTPGTTPGKRKAPQALSSSPRFQSSPCKRVRTQDSHLDVFSSSPPRLDAILEVSHDMDDSDVYMDDDEDQEFRVISQPVLRKPAVPIKRLETSLNTRLIERSFGGFDMLGRGRRRDRWDLLPYTTANFYSKATDKWQFGKPNHPFCTASTNTNSLIAIGTETGCVAVHDSTDGKMMEPVVRFWPHGNAVLDMQFSPDDMTLATTSGDRSARLVDMTTQKVKAWFDLHWASVKQVRFQPGDPNVVATSSREGLVAIWDVRCRSDVRPVKHMYMPSDRSTDIVESDHTCRLYTEALYSFHRAHQDRQPNTIRAPTVSCFDPNCNAEEKIGASVTSISFLSESRNHLLLTASEASTSIKMWDLRSRTSRRANKAPTPVSSTTPPLSHAATRDWGITSLAVSPSVDRTYVLCRDNNLYAYATSHLLLGSATSLQPSNSSLRPCAEDKPGLGPIYALRNPRMRVSSFFVRCAIRPAKEDRPELLCTGSGEGTPIVYDLNEKMLPKPDDVKIPPGGIPTYTTGTALIRGHQREVNYVNWTKDGDLLTASDDMMVRCWRENKRIASAYRRVAKDDSIQADHATHNCAWSDVDAEHDEIR